MDKIYDSSGKPIFTKGNPAYVNLVDANKNAPVELIKNVTITSEVGRQIKWMDKDKNLWATQAQKVQKSVDWGTNWTDVLTVDEPTYGNLAAAGLMVLDSGKIIIGTSTGKVLISNVAQTTVALAYAFGDTGVFSYQFAHLAYQNIAIIGGYISAATGANKSTQVWATFDDGVTWTKIYDMPVVNAAHNAHIHDVEYDMLNDRIIVVFGDTDNKGMAYTDDRGVTWTQPLNKDIIPQSVQATQIIAYPHGVVFGSDSTSEGLYYWPKPSNVSNPPFDPSTYDVNFYTMLPRGSLNHFAVRRWVTRDADNPLTLLPITRQNGGTCRLLASKDGLKWFEIWRNPDRTVAGLRNIVGPNADGKIAGLYDKSGVIYVFKAEIPGFYK